MPRKPAEIDAIGSDSFLDVVTNIVGILIILVVVVGIRVKNAPPVAAVAEAPVAPTVDPSTLGRLRDEAAKAEHRVLALERQLEALESATESAREECEELAQQTAMARRTLDDAQHALGDDAARQFELERSLDETQAAVDEAQRELDRIIAERKAAQTVEIVSYHTPIGRTVEGEEVHFQLRANRVAYVAKDDLEKALVQAVKEKAGSLLQNKRDATLVVGPILDYRMKAHIRRVDQGVAVQYGAVVSSVELIEYILLPIANNLGETAEEALDGTSEFWSRVRRANPKTATITLWTSADGYDVFRKLKKQLYEQGYAVACRVLPDGHPIGGSPQGSKTVRQ